MKKFTLALSLAAAIAVAGMMAAPSAYAFDDRRHDERWHRDHDPHWHDPHWHRPVYVEPPPAAVYAPPVEVYAPPPGPPVLGFGLDVHIR